MFVSGLIETLGPQAFRESAHQPIDQLPHQEDVFMRHVTAFLIGLSIAFGAAVALGAVLVLGANDVKAKTMGTQSGTGDAAAATTGGATTGGATTGAAPTGPAQLRSHVLVNGREVHLGDLFDGAGRYAGKTIAYAPAPGRKLTLEASWLYRVARAYGVRWRPTSTLDQAIVERRSVLVDTTQIQDAILQESRRKNKTPGKLEVVLDNRILQLHLPVDMPAVVTVRSLTHDIRSGRFSALVFAPDPRPGAIRMTITGEIHRLMDVPVLSRRAAPGDIIAAGDIEWITLRSSRISSHVILDDAKLVGMSPKRPLTENRPIRLTEIRTPILVKKNSRVTVFYKTPFLRLSATGKALQNGAKGDVIRVRNLRSKNIIDAIVVSSGHVTVTSVGQLASR
jgi:flagellar basal body P-ring formation protein FlgA